MSLSLFDQEGSILVSEKIKSEFQQSEKLLPEIEKLFKKNKIQYSDLQGILVITGPGGFTSLRIGVATANALAYSLQIPILGIKSAYNSDLEIIQANYKELSKLKEFKQVLPEYGAEPNIGKSKK
jgi:tRNA threonylcarbamoyl adenosine modification protein YeaZ